MFLGIDIGTQSVKTLLYDINAARVVDVQSAPLELISRTDGTREQLAAWWIQALGDCLLRLNPAHKAAVKGIGVSGQQHGFVALDKAGEVLAPVKLWCDTSTILECDEIGASFGGAEQCIRELGNPILPGYTASKILWLKKHKPELYEQLATVLLPHDYVNFYLTGDRVMECGDASGTGLLDVRNRQWHTGLARAIDSERNLLECMPPLVEPDLPIGQLRQTCAEAYGLRAGIPVSAGGGDNMMAAIGTGNVTRGRLTVSLGTSGTLFAYSDKPVIDEGAAVAAFCSSTGGWLPLLCTMNCTVSTELTRDLFNLDIAALEANVASIPPGSNGVMTLPFFNGERTPNLPSAKGCLFGLDEANYTQANVLRSAMESSVYGLRSGLDTLKQLDCDIFEVRLTGGGAGSPAWRQMVADIFDMPVTVQHNDEGAALGAALQACWAHENANANRVDIKDLVDSQLQTDPARGCDPDAAAARAYANHYLEYSRHVDLVSKLYA
jgi:xylulokinase